MAATIVKTSRQDYQHSLQQLALLQKYGPFGIKVQRGDFVIRSRCERLMVYGVFALSILRICSRPNLSEAISLAQKKVNIIGRAHSEISMGDPFSFLDLYFGAVKVIYSWNHSMGIPEGRIGRLQRWLLGSEWNQKHLENLQIEYSGMVPAACEMFARDDNVSFAYVTKEPFPLAILPRGPLINSLPACMNWLESQQKELQALLKQQGALIFKGFPIGNGEQFAAAVKAILRKDPIEYHGEGSRDRVGKNVYTSTKAPLDYKIRLHHELTCTQNPAEYICFYCASAPTPGTGHTTLGKTLPISLAIEADKELWALFKGKNIRYISRHPSTGHWLTRINPTHRTWQLVCNTEDKAKAEAELKLKAGFSYRWTKEFLEISRIAPAMIKDKVTRTSDIWYNQMHLYHANPVGRGGWLNHILASCLYARRHTRQYDVEFEDGTPIPRWAVYRVYEILQRHEVEPEWQRGDFMIVDNYEAMHGKNPSEGPRRILATFM